MVSDLAMWEAATAPDVDVQRVAWAELTALTRAVRGLRTYEASGVIRRVTSAALAVRRSLASTPLPPNDPAIGLSDIAEDIRTFLEEHPTHTAAAALRAVVDAATALHAGASPLAEWVGDTLSEYGAWSDGTPEAVLVVPRNHLLAPTTAWLNLEGLTCVDVATPSQLRDRCDHTAVLVLGHPGPTYSTPFAPPTLAVRRVGWLLTAPPAQHVRLVLLADDPPLTEGDVWVWPDAATHPSWQLTVPPRTTPAVTETEWIADVPATPATAVRPRETSDDDVPATAVITASGHTIYFSPDTGAKPRFLGLEDTGHVTMSSVTIAQLRPGRVLVEHTSGAARDALIARANQWLLDNKGWARERIDAARQGSTALKFVVIQAIRERSLAGLVDALAGTGLSPDYARGLPDRVLDLDYIAPRRNGFDALLSVGARLDWDDIQHDFVGMARAVAHDLPTLRAAHQHAGNMIHRDLREQLQGRVWEDDVTINGWALISDDTLGDVLLTTVVALDSTHLVPRSWLGVPKSRDGQ